MRNLQLLFVALVAGSALAKPGPGASTPYTRVYSDANNMGNYLDVSQYVPDLSNNGMNNNIESVHQTGMWVYYENPNYNVASAGRIYFVHGIELSQTFPFNYRNMASSIRSAGDRSILNADTFTLYTGQYFTGEEFFGEQDASVLSALDQRASSLILTGQSAWTFYTGQQWTGNHVCVHPNSDHDVGPNGERLDLGIYTIITAVGLAENSVRSVRKGCWSPNIAPPSNIKYEFKSQNGAYGYVDV